MENEHEEEPSKIPQHPLNERIEAIEHRLDEHKKTLDNLETILLETRRFLARHSIEELRLFLEDWTAKSLLTTNPPLYQEIHDFLTDRSSAARQAVIKSTAPISVAELFETRCQEYFKSHNLRAFR